MSVFLICHAFLGQFSFLGRFIHCLFLFGYVILEVYISHVTFLAADILKCLYFERTGHFITLKCSFSSNVFLILKASFLLLACLYLLFLVLSSCVFSSPSISLWKTCDSYRISICGVWICLVQGVALLGGMALLEKVCHIVGEVSFGTLLLATRKPVFSEFPCLNEQDGKLSSYITMRAWMLPCFLP